MNTTPINTDLPAILAHARGRMTPEECAFWAQARAGARDHGAELAVIAHHHPSEPCDVPVLRVRNGLDGWASTPVDAGWSAFLPGDPVVQDEDELLSLAAFWQGPESPADGRHLSRIQALRRHATAYTHALRWLRPSLALIWNGHHPQERVLHSLCARVGISTHWCERGPIPGTLHTDALGVLGGSSIARATLEDLSGISGATREQGLAMLDELRDPAASTWWAQPVSGGTPLRERFDLGARTKLIVFAGQVDQDVQALRFGGGHQGNAEAFGAFLRALPTDRDDLFVVGKHHPQSGTPEREYRRAIESAGWSERAVWIDDVPLGEALEQADAVAAVNSTVLTEACARGIPILAMGESILSGKQIAFSTDAVGAWLDATEAETSARREHLADLLGALASNAQGGLWWIDAHGDRPGAHELGAHLASIAVAAAPASIERLPSVPPLLDELALWDRARMNRPTQTARPSAA